MSTPTEPEIDLSHLLVPMRPPPDGPAGVRRAARQRRLRRRRLVGSTAALALLGAGVGVALARRSSTPTLRTVVPPAGAQIAFTRAIPALGPDLTTAEIVLVKPDGSAETPLTRRARLGRVALAPAWSPDHRRVAFVDGTPKSGRNAGIGNIAVVDSDGSHLRRLTRTNTDTGPAWSPDGSRIAFVRFGAGLANIHVMHADGSGVRRLTRLGALDPRWSPDGRFITFTSPLPNRGNKHVFVMRADGSGIRQLTHGVEEYDPAWSPAGDEIAFGDSRDSNLYTIRPDGTHLRRLTTCQWPACIADLEPAWSPDGRTLVFARDIAGNRQLFVVNADGTGIRRLTNDAADDCCAAW